MVIGAVMLVDRGMARLQRGSRTRAFRRLAEQNQKRRASPSAGAPLLILNCLRGFAPQTRNALREKGNKPSSESLL